MPVYSSHLLQYEDLKLGERFREERQRRGLKLRDLARKVGISAARLSQIENERHVPSLRQALAIAEALALPPRTLLPPDVRLPYQIARASEVRSGPPRQVRLKSPHKGGVVHHHEFWPVADRFIGRHLETVLGRIHQVAGNNRYFCCHHEEEFLFVLKGSLEFLCRTPDGLVREELRRGDCITFRSDMPHCLTSLEPEPAETIHVLASESAPVETGFDRLSWDQSAFLAPDGSTDASQQFSEKLKALREAHGWTVAQVASVAGLSERQLQRIESGERAVPFRTILPLARAFGKPLGELIGQTADRGPYHFVQRSDAIASIPSRARRTPVELPSAPRSKTCQPLASGFPARHMYPYLVRLLQVDVETLTMHEHHGHEFIYVLGGELELTTYAQDKQVTEVLRPGDSCYLDSSVPHLVRGENRNPYSQTTAEVIDVFWSPLGENYLFGE